MNLALECKKIKRTGFVPAFFGGGAFACAFPLLNMAVRSEMYVSREGSPVAILLEANWQMMAMLNVLLLVVGSCILYHMEYADNAMQKMDTLPIWECSLFFRKLWLLLVILALVLVLEVATIGFCAFYWFGSSAGGASGAMVGQMLLLAKVFGFSFLMTVPAALLALFIASICQNMWVSLGLGVIAVFIATMLPMDHFVLSLFPFSLPFQTFTSVAESGAISFVGESVTSGAAGVAGVGMLGTGTASVGAIVKYIVAAVVESVGLCVMEVISRRLFT